MLKTCYELKRLNLAVIHAGTFNQGIVSKTPAAINHVCFFEKDAFGSIAIDATPL